MTKRQRKVKLQKARAHQQRCRERNRLSKPAPSVAAAPATIKKQPVTKKWLRRVGRKVRST